MDLKERILSSEMRHVTELVNLLSCELVVLQDFLIREFGSKKYNKFRKNHPLASGSNLSYARETRSAYTGPSRDCDDQRNQSVFNRTKLRSGTIITSGFSHPSSKDSAHSNDNAPKNKNSDPGANATIEDEERNDDNDDNLYEEVEADVVTGADQMLHENSEDESSSSSDTHDDDMDWTESKGSYFDTKRGRVMMQIWSKYNCKVLPNGKKIARCQNCNDTVSPVRKRLQKHYDSCVLNKSVKKEKPVKKISTQEKETKPRRSKSSVWHHFIKSISESGQVIVTCSYCTKKVSNHSTRMARHLENCDKCTLFDDDPGETCSLNDNSCLAIENNTDKLSN